MISCLWERQKTKTTQTETSSWLTSCQLEAQPGIMRKSRQEEQLVAAGHTVASIRKENEPRMPSPQLPFRVLYNPDPLPRE